MRISDWSSDVCSSDLLPYGVPVWHALQLDAAYDGLGFLHAPVGAEVFMQPQKARGVLAFVDRFPAFAMVFVRPDLAPQCWAVGGDHAAFAARGHDFVLAERPGDDMTYRSHWAVYVAGAVCMCAIFDHP